jgi:hypothetical protein
MKKSIVISHYNENLDWVHTIPNDISIYLYTKGNCVISPSILKRVIFCKLENTGNEQHTYFHHIFHNYKNLNSDDIVYFIQANPFDHCKNVYEKLLKTSTSGLSDFNYITTIYGEVDSNLYTTSINHRYEKNFVYTNVTNTIFTDPWNDENAKYHMNYIIDTIDIGISKKNWTFNANGMYCVSNKSLKFFNKNFYELCLSFFYKKELNMAAHAFERLNRFILLRDNFL